SERRCYGAWRECGKWRQSIRAWYGDSLFTDVPLIFAREPMPKLIGVIRRNAGGAIVLFLFLGSALFELSAQEKTSGAAKDSSITEQEARDFATALTEAAKEGDKDTFLKLIDWGAICDKATEIPNLPELVKARTNFKTGVISAVNKSGGMLTPIHDAIEQGGSYKALRIDVKDKVPTVLFRLNLPGGGGVNYHRYSLVRKSDGVVAINLFIFLSAENVSDSLRRNWLPVAKQALEAGGGKKTVQDDPFLAHIAEYKQTVTLVQEKK